MSQDPAPQAKPEAKTIDPLKRAWLLKKVGHAQVPGLGMVDLVVSFSGTEYFRTKNGTLLSTKLKDRSASGKAQRRERIKARRKQALLKADETQGEAEPVSLMEART